MLRRHFEADGRGLLGYPAVREGMALVTLDKAVVHLAGDEHREHVLLLEAK
jgi:hypothetical protein